MHGRWITSWNHGHGRKGHAGSSVGEQEGLAVRLVLGLLLVGLGLLLGLVFGLTKWALGLGLGPIKIINKKNIKTITQ